MNKDSIGKSLGFTEGKETNCISPNFMGENLYFAKF